MSYLPDVVAVLVTECVCWILLVVADSGWYCMDVSNFIMCTNMYITNWHINKLIGKSQNLWAHCLWTKGINRASFILRLKLRKQQTLSSQELLEDRPLSSVKTLTCARSKWRPSLSFCLPCFLGLLSSWLSEQTQSQVLSQMLILMPTPTLMLILMPTLTLMQAGLPGLPGDLLITTTVTDAPNGAPLATVWTTIAAPADAPESAPTDTLWMSVAASVSPGHPIACALRPLPYRTTTPTNGWISVHLGPTHGAAKRMAAHGPALITNQLQDGWCKWISWNFHHDL